MNKISVTVITKDEEKNISDCLASVKWADEIIVVDSESNDRTVDLAKQFTDRIFIRKWEGYVPQKRYALSLASNEWVLSLDADERITPELKDEILSLLPGEVDGYKIRRKNFLLKKEITSCGWEKDFQLRLFRKDKANLSDRLVHEKFVVEGKVGHFEISNASLYFFFVSRILCKNKSLHKSQGSGAIQKKEKSWWLDDFLSYSLSIFCFLYNQTGF